MAKIFPTIVRRTTNVVAGGDFVTTELEKLTLQFKVLTVRGSITLETPTFVYATETQGSIKIGNLALIYQAMTAMGAVSGVLNPRFTAITAQGNVTMPALVEVGLTQVAGTLSGVDRLVYDALVARGDIKVGDVRANYTGNPLTVRGNITMPALAEVGTTQVTCGGGPKIAAVQVRGLSMGNCRIANTSAGIGLTYELDFTGLATNTDRNFTIPAGVTSLRADVWAGGGGGAGGSAVNGGGGGGGGGYAREDARTVAAGDNIVVRVGAGGATGATPTAGSVSRVTHIATVIAEASGGGAGVNGGAGGHGAGGANGAGTIGDVLRNGGSGGGPNGGVNLNGGGGGGGAGTNNAGGNGGNGPGAGGAGGAELGGTGGSGANAATPATAASERGGGGGGDSTLAPGTAGAKGGVKLRFAA